MIPLFVGAGKGVSQVHGLDLPVDCKRDGLVLACSSTSKNAVAPNQIAAALVSAGPCLGPLGNALIQRCLAAALETGCDGGETIGLVGIRAVVSYITQAILKGSSRRTVTRTGGMRARRQQGRGRNS